MPAMYARLDAHRRVCLTYLTPEPPYADVSPLKPVDEWLFSCLSDAASSPIDTARLCELINVLATQAKIPDWAAHTRSTARSAYEACLKWRLRASAWTDRHTPETGYSQAVLLGSAVHSPGLAFAEIIPADVYLEVLAANQAVRVAVRPTPRAIAASRDWRFDSSAMAYLCGEMIWTLSEAELLQFGRERAETIVLDTARRHRDSVRRLDRLDSEQSRSPIPRPLRRLVLERDKGRCCECGSDINLEIDHIIPVRLGGATSEANLQLLCRDCNRRKGACL